MVDEEYGYCGNTDQKQAERAELIQKLLGYCSRRDVIFAMLDDKCYTKNGRMNRSAICRATGVSSQTLDEVLDEMREILEEEFEGVPPKPRLTKPKLVKSTVKNENTIRSYVSPEIE